MGKSQKPLISVAEELSTMCRGRVTRLLNLGDIYHSISNKKGVKYIRNTECILRKGKVA
jgi:hypothetical protein